MGGCARKPKILYFKYDHTIKEQKDKIEGLAVLKKTPIEDMWYNELEEFLVVLEEIE